MPAQKTQKAVPRRWGDRSLIVCEGGPLHGHWYFAEEFTVQQTAAVRLGCTASQPAGISLAYHSSQPYRGTGHPQFDVVGQVLVYDPRNSAEPGDHEFVSAAQTFGADHLAGTAQAA
jgi:hypothetical protein